MKKLPPLAKLAALKDQLLPRIDVENAGDSKRLVSAGLWIIGISFGVVGSWMAFAPLSGAVVSSGLVKVDMNRKTVQHQEGGIIKEILVRDGDLVREGQLLMTLNDVRVDASFELVRQQFDSERARGSRLVAERDGKRSVEFPSDLLTRAERESRIREFLDRERSLFTSRLATLDSQITLLKAQIVQTREEQGALTQQVAADTRAMQLQQQQLKQNEDLIKQGFVSQARNLELQRAVADYESRKSERVAEVAKSKQRQTELELKIVGLRNNYMQTAADELKDNANKTFELQERLRPSVDAAERQKIVAPATGEIVDMKFTSAGAVIGPRDPILDIVPRHAKLIIEGRIRTEDVNHVRAGSIADVRLVAFNQRITPVVEGKVTYVSGDRLIDRATNQPYYQINVDLLPESLKEAGDLKLQAGMPVEIFVKTVERTALEYLFDPITAFIRRAFRET
ncbi:MAG: HlyD family type I secretion periplasmic adaptor subunit [Rhodocyclaceae bacterium]|nr:HlyD family type I secretion periplasmic adaptor subunit [Rhodocyclaceae bacterium]